MLDAKQVIEALTRCRVIVSMTDAIEKAGSCRQRAALPAAKLDGVELFGHPRGYVWAIYYAHGKQRSHFALIHADGTPLAAAIAAEFVQIDRQCDHILDGLTYLPPPAHDQQRLNMAAEAATKYRQWLVEECGYMQLDGLPADTDLSATRLKLERMFVPMKACLIPKKANNEQISDQSTPVIDSIGNMLAQYPHLALLAAPGGGKSTLIKRLATAYALPERRAEVADGLPQRDLLPLILRCRDLRERAHASILDLLHLIPQLACMSADETRIFQETTHEALRAGKAMLLVDGLDELSDEAGRMAFAKSLRTFIGMFPQVGLLLTSREAGFRLVAGVVASVCQQATIATLDQDDVQDLCVRWHVEVMADTPKVRADAQALATTIWDNERIRSLAENPLLLTTLLVVNRTTRELPRRRTDLYREAIRVLVRTWNIEGYIPMDEDATLAQLSYIASAMMERGIQRIGRKSLLKLLIDARDELEAELRYVDNSPQEFIERIESRSSLLMQTGHAEIDGDVQAVYEFRHLTFQEYLTARAYVEEQYPRRNEGKSLADLLAVHFEDERWREVIPLAAVLAKHKAGALVARLIQTCEGMERMSLGETSLPVTLLDQCIEDQVQVSKTILINALRQLGRHFRLFDEILGERLLHKKLEGSNGMLFQETVEQSYLRSGEASFDYLDAMAGIAWHRANVDRKNDGTTTALMATLHAQLQHSEQLVRIRAALVCMKDAYEIRNENRSESESGLPRQDFSSVCDGLVGMLASGDPLEGVPASWALAWIGKERLLGRSPPLNLLLSLFQLWRQLALSEAARFPASALSAQALLPRDSFAVDAWGDCDSFLLEVDKWRSDNFFMASSFKSAMFVVAWYRRAPWSDSELVARISQSFPSGPYEFMPKTKRELLENLGDAGQAVLAQWDRSRSEQSKRD